MKVWFMYDCHLFTSVGDGATSREQMVAKAKELFAKDYDSKVLDCYRMR